jgi:hypothetical protein
MLRSCPGHFEVSDFMKSVVQREVIGQRVLPDSDLAVLYGVRVKTPSEGPSNFARINQRPVYSLVDAISRSLSLNSISHLFA